MTPLVPPLSSPHSRPLILPLKASEVHGIAQCIPSIPLAHEDSMTMLVATQLISQQYLHRALREEGGAYGGGVGYSSAGYVTFQSLYTSQCSEISTLRNENIHLLTTCK